MSYSYPTKICATPADAVAVGLELAQRQSGSLTTNGGIVAADGSPAVPQLGVDAAGMGLAYLQAIADVTLAACGYQDQSHEMATADSSASEEYVNTPGFVGWTFMAPIAKTYLVAVDCTAYMTALPNVILYWRLLVNGEPAGERSFVFKNADWALPMSFRMPAPMVKGENDIRLQWKMGAAVTAVTTVENFRTFTVSG